MKHTKKPAKKTPAKKQARGAPLTPVKNTPDLTDWTLAAFDKVSDLVVAGVRQGVQDALEVAFTDKNTYFHWRDIHLSDVRAAGQSPLMLELTVALGNGDDRTDPAYAFDLAETLTHHLDECHEDGSYREGLRRLAVALRTFVDEIDAAVKSTPTRG